jgi:hypothetical protein
MGKWFDIPWVGGVKIPWIGGVKIPWVGVQNTMDRRIDIPWIRGSIYHG